MKNITVGFFSSSDKKFLSGIVINENFLDLLSRYVKVKKIALRRGGDLKNRFKKIEKYRLDYLYVNGYEALLESFLLRERLCLDIPFIVKLHTVFPWAPKYAHAIPLIRKRDIIFAPSEYAKESFSRISPKIKIHIIPNCLDIKYIQKNAPHIDKAGDKKTIVFMGRLTEGKGMGTLIRCMPELIKKIGDVHLNIIGPLSGSQITDSPKGKYVKRLESEAKKLGLGGKVNFMGARLGSEKYKALSGADVFVNPTLAREETFGIVNIEALACGLPVIATDWGANKEIIINGDNGYLVGVDHGINGTPQVNTAQLISSIANVLTDTRLNLKLKKAAANTARRYDYRKVLHRLIGLFKKGGHSRQDKWDLIKDKGIAHFGNLFNRDFLFFIYGIHPKLRIETYGDLYVKLIERRAIRARSHLTAKKATPKKNIRYEKIMDKMSCDYKNFLCLKGA